jgi:hypothetical protein
MAKAISFKEYDASKHKLPIASKNLKAGERVQGVTKGIVQHDCERGNPVVILFDDGNPHHYTKLWITED